MADPFSGRPWTPISQGRPQCSKYSAAAETPTKPEYDKWGAPKRKPNTFTVPVHAPPDHPARSSSPVTKGNCPSKSNPKKGISIPIIDSKAPVSSPGIKKASAPRMDETSAAIKTQSAFRGFSARKSAPLKNLRVIRDVMVEAEDIRRRLSDRQVVESIRQNEKERLKITEGIMSLLLKLDAIQGVNSFVRESRKAVNRELVSLHEMVDAIFDGKSIEGTGSVGVEAEEEGNHGDERASDGEENGDVEEIRDQELLERGPNEEEIRNEEVLDGVKLASANEDVIKRLKDLDLLQAESEAKTIQAHEDHREGEKTGEVIEAGARKNVNVEEEAKTIQAHEEHREGEETGEVIEAGARKNVNVEEDIVKVKDECERLKKTVVDLWKKTESHDKLISNLSLRIAQLQEKISK